MTGLCNQEEIDIAEVVGRALGERADEDGRAQVRRLIDIVGQTLDGPALPMARKSQRASHDSQYARARRGRARIQRWA